MDNPTGRSFLWVGFIAMMAIGSAAIAWAQDTPAPPASGAPPPNTTGLASLGAEWRTTNPYRGDPKAITYGKSLFAENCARCHGIGAISGGIAPDLRYLPAGAEGDAIFSNRVQNGSSKDGRVVMPKWGPVLGQEALWTIRSWLDTVRED